MKRPTQAGWVRLLKSYETAFNALLAEPLQPHEKESLLIVHTLIRKRAVGVEK
mgnify:CR=1 FL=1